MAARHRGQVKFAPLRGATYRTAATRGFAHRRCRRRGDRSAERQCPGAHPQRLLPGRARTILVAAANPPAASRPHRSGTGCPTSPTRPDWPLAGTNLDPGRRLGRRPHRPFVEFATASSGPGSGGIRDPARSADVACTVDAASPNLSLVGHHRCPAQTPQFARARTASAPPARVWRRDGSTGDRGCGQPSAAGRCCRGARARTPNRPELPAARHG